MDYQERIKELATKFFMELLPGYQNVAAEFMKKGRKLNLFRKVDYVGYIDSLKGFQGEADEMIRELTDIEIPEEDVKGENLAETFIEALEEYQKMCERGVRFNELQDQKQNHQPISMEDVRLALQGMQLGARSAGAAAEKLDLTYRVYVGVLPEDALNQEPEEADDTEEPDELEED